MNSCKIETPAFELSIALDGNVLRQRTIDFKPRLQYDDPTITINPRASLKFHPIVALDSV